MPASSGLVLVSPAGSAAGTIRYHERLQPAATFGSWVERTLLGDPSFTARAVGPRELLSTREGEHAARVVVDGERGGAPARRFIGGVLAEDFVALIDALALGRRERDDWDDLSRELLEGVSLRLGSRPRRFAYTAPPGWHAIATGLTVGHYPPDYPRHAAQIVVHPAEPSAALDLDALFARMMSEERARGRLFTPTGTRRAVDLPSGLEGRTEEYAATLEGRVSLREMCVLFGGHYTYMMKLDSFVTSRWGEVRLAFDALVASARPVPVALPGIAGAGALSHWVD